MGITCNNDNWIMPNFNNIDFHRLKQSHMETGIASDMLKSLSPIHFVKIRLTNFLGQEFLVKKYKL